MTEVPKIVYDRLRAAQKARPLPGAALPEQEHPDADLLVAFAEQTLSVTERDATLDHLALCGDCREVIALALPAVDIVAVPIAAETEADWATPVLAKTERNWLTLAGWPKLAWPSLRWAALAAGVVVVASLLLVHPGKLNQAMLPAANQVATTQPPVSGLQIASSAVPPSPIAPPIKQPAISAKTGEARPKAKKQLTRKSASQGVQADERLTSSHQSPPGETVEVAAARPLVAQEPSVEGTLIAQNEAPAIEKAKPPLQDAEAQGTEPSAQQQPKTATSPTLPGTNAMSLAKLARTATPPLAQHDVAWKISAGVLQHSLDSGQSWQVALHPNHPLLCYASHGEDIWTGGHAGTLFHSTDGGSTWVQVQPSTKGQQLSSDVTNIELQDDLQGGSLHGNQTGNAPRPSHIVLSTSNNDVWSSADGGITWQKK
ncbi:MAG: hypothetical protein ACLQEI_22535 [Terriglobales bacterium]